MVKAYLVDIAVKRIQGGTINPNTGLPLVVEDLAPEYREAVRAALQQTP